MARRFALIATVQVAAALLAGPVVAAGKPGYPDTVSPWLFRGAAPASGLPTEVVVESFAFAP